ncbi:MAG: DUF4258 domain-containing protein [Patescibacteria group bacterium]|nr:DUF4258 domain-containing protein [Patescibacteria group bacterium]
MQVRFTRHALEKFSRMKDAGFDLTKIDIQKVVEHPFKLENTTDNTKIATQLLDDHHVIRVVFREEDDIILIITFYPGRIKAYEI